jgi:hypothetical protein
MLSKTHHVDDEWLAKAMRDSDRGEDIQAIARLLFSRNGHEDSADDNVQHFVVHLTEKKLLPPLER